MKPAENDARVPPVLRMKCVANYLHKIGRIVCRGCRPIAEKAEKKERCGDESCRIEVS
jgi:hypothetical protein